MQSLRDSIGSLYIYGTDMFDGTDCLIMWCSVCLIIPVVGVAYVFGIKSDDEVHIFNII